MYNLHQCNWWKSRETKKLFIYLYLPLFHYLEKADAARIVLKSATFSVNSVHNVDNRAVFEQYEFEQRELVMECWTSYKDILLAACIQFGTTRVKDNTS